jgi:hypothetical protein
MTRPQHDESNNGNQYRISLYYRDSDTPEVLIPTIGVEPGKALVANWYFDSAMRNQYGGREHVSHISLEELQQDGSWRPILSAVDPWQWG